VALPIARRHRLFWLRQALKRHPRLGLKPFPQSPVPGLRKDSSAAFIRDRLLNDTAAGELQHKVAK